MKFFLLALSWCCNCTCLSHAIKVYVISKLYLPVQLVTGDGLSENMTECHLLFIVGQVWSTLQLSILLNNRCKVEDYSDIFEQLRLLSNLTSPIRYTIIVVGVKLLRQLEGFLSSLCTSIGFHWRRDNFRWLLCYKAFEAYIHTYIHMYIYDFTSRVYVVRVVFRNSKSILCEAEN